MPNSLDLSLRSKGWRNMIYTSKYHSVYSLENGVVGSKSESRIRELCHVVLNCWTGNTSGALEVCMAVCPSPEFCALQVFCLLCLLLLGKASSFLLWLSQPEPVSLTPSWKSHFSKGYFQNVPVTFDSIYEHLNYYVCPKPVPYSLFLIWVAFIHPLAK